MKDQEKKLLEQAVNEINSLRNRNKTIGMRLEIYDDMISLFHSSQSNTMGMGHPDIVHEIETYLEKLSG